MKCMHCRVAYHANEAVRYLGDDVDGSWSILCSTCPSCKRLNLFLGQYEDFVRGPNGNRSDNLISRVPIRPRGALRLPCPPQVPTPIAEDDNEACIVLPDSVKASAALSRRCLQNVIEQAAHVKPGNLANQIGEVINSASLPSDIAKMLDAVSIDRELCCSSNKEREYGRNTTR